MLGSVLNFCPTGSNSLEARWNISDDAHGDDYDVGGDHAEDDAHNDDDEEPDDDGEDNMGGDHAAADDDDS